MAKVGIGWTARPAHIHAAIVGTALILAATGCRGAVTVDGTGPRSPEGVVNTLVTPPQTTSPAPVTPVPVTPVPGGGGGAAAAGGDNLVTLDGSARSVHTSAAVTGLSSVHLSGSMVLTATGDVVDRNGRDLGTGSLRAQDSDVVVSAATLQLDSEVRVQPSVVTLNDGTSGAVGIGFSGSASVSAASITFQRPPPPYSAPAAGSPATVPTTTTVPPPVSVAGPVTLRAGGLEIAGTNLTLVNPPAQLSLKSQEADLSWAGSGSLVTAQGTFRAPYLGVRAQQLQVTLQRSSRAVTVHGTGLALQAYANGVPQLRISARIDILGTNATTGFFNRKPAFVWTPHNLDNHYDMAILSIHPANAAARGVHLRLLPMPAMFGGEPHALVGGDTSGLKSGDAIDSLIARNGDDKRSIGYDASPDVPLVLIVEGNFAPITVTVTSY